MWLRVPPALRPLLLRECRRAQRLAVTDPLAPAGSLDAAVAKLKASQANLATTITTAKTTK
jgi:hypothetical protein